MDVLRLGHVQRDVFVEVWLVELVDLRLEKRCPLWRRPRGRYRGGRGRGLLLLLVTMLVLVLVRAATKRLLRAATILLRAAILACEKLAHHH